jgi:hypothetical protein
MTHDMTHDFSRTPVVFTAEKTPQLGTENDPFLPQLTHGLTHGFRLAASPSSCTNVTQFASRFVNRAAHLPIDKKNSGQHPLNSQKISRRFCPLSPGNKKKVPPPFFQAEFIAHPAYYLTLYFLTLRNAVL